MAQLCSLSVIAKVNEMRRHNKQWNLAFHVAQCEWTLKASKIWDLELPLPTCEQRPVHTERLRNGSLYIDTQCPSKRSNVPPVNVLWVVRCKQALRWNYNNDIVKVIAKIKLCTCCLNEPHPNSANMNSNRHSLYSN